MAGPKFEKVYSLRNKAIFIFMGKKYNCGHQSLVTLFQVLLRVTQRPSRPGRGAVCGQPTCQPLPEELRDDHPGVLGWGQQVHLHRPHLLRVRIHAHHFRQLWQRSSGIRASQSGPIWGQKTIRWVISCGIMPALQHFEVEISSNVLNSPKFKNICT